MELQGSTVYETRTGVTHCLCFLYLNGFQKTKKHRQSVTRGDLKLRGKRKSGALTRVVRWLGTSYATRRVDVHTVVVSLGLSPV